MYKLKDKYKDSWLSKAGNKIRLSDVRLDQVESLGLEKYFTKEKDVAMKPNKKRTYKK